MAVQASKYDYLYVPTYMNMRNLGEIIDMQGPKEMNTLINIHTCQPSTSEVGSVCSCQSSSGFTILTFKDITASLRVEARLHWRCLSYLVRPQVLKVFV